jgi:hypothetical protein
MNIALPSLFSLVFIAIGGVLIYFAMKIAAKARQSLSWPSTDGEISHSAVLYQTNSTAASDDSTSTYKADISYRYKVDGANFSSARISLLDFASTTGHAQSLVERYPDDSTVEVYYNPSNFSEAVLEPGYTTGISILFMAGGIFAAGGFFILIMGLTGHVHVGGSLGAPAARGGPVSVIELRQIGSSLLELALI